MTTVSIVFKETRPEDGKHVTRSFHPSWGHSPSVKYEGAFVSVWDPRTEDTISFPACDIVEVKQERGR